jgi:hypothetical protein
MNMQANMRVSGTVSIPTGVPAGTTSPTVQEAFDNLKSAICDLVSTIGTSETCFDPVCLPAVSSNTDPAYPPTPPASVVAVALIEQTRILRNQINRLSELNRRCSL